MRISSEDAVEDTACIERAREDTAAEKEAVLLLTFLPAAMGVVSKFVMAVSDLNETLWPRVARGLRICFGAMFVQRNARLTW